MNLRNVSFTLALMAGASLSLGACGGGGSKKAPAPAPAPVVVTPGPVKPELCTTVATCQAELDAAKKIIADLEADDDATLGQIKKAKEVVDAAETQLAEVTPPPPPTPVEVALPADVPEGAGATAGDTLTIAAGETGESGGIEFTCAADGDACMVKVDEDGMATSTGGEVSTGLTMTAQTALDEAQMMARAVTQRRAIKSALDAASAAVAAVDDDATDAQITTADNAVTTAKKAIADAADVSQTERAANTGTVAVLESRLGDAKTRRTAAIDTANDEAQKAINAMTKKLHTGLGVAKDNALRVVTVVTTPGGKLMAKVDSDDVTLSGSGAVAPTISGWNGVDYRMTKAGITNHAVAYTNPAPPTRQAFEVKHNTIIDDKNGEIPKKSFGEFTIAGSGFASGSGEKTHAVPTGAHYVSVRGTFDGAPGSFRCPNMCTSSVADATGVSLSDEWYFVADAGAMTSTPDADYLLFGWWARDAGMTVGVATFVYTVGEATKSQNIQALEGSATYSGGATGKAAIYNPPSDDNEAGVFNARATLKAKFGIKNVGGTISGTLDNFSVDGRTKDWSVALKETVIADTGVADFGGASAVTAVTAWTIGGEVAADSGMWEGALYELDADTKVPMTAAGTFNSNYGNVGRMVGAFGATKQ